MLIILFVFGACVGSFLNVCIYRIPAGLSVVSPGSRCPSCLNPIAPYNNIPIVSYLVLGGRCPDCHARFSAQYLLVEAAAGVLAALLFLRFGPGYPLLAYFVFTSALIVVTFIDLERRIIPDVISLPGIVVGFAASFFIPDLYFINSLAGILLGGGLLFAIAYAYHLVTGKEGMGGGDIKLLAMIGAFTGWKGVLMTVLIGSFTGSIIGGALMFRFGKSPKYAIPFGPFLALGALSYVFFGERMIAWYLARAFGG